MQAGRDRPELILRHHDRKDHSMRFMMIMYPGIAEESDWTPTPEAVAAMGRYNEELREAGVLLSLDGLHPTSQGARVAFAGGRPSVTDGPFADTKEVLGGYWLIDVASKEQAVAWASRCPAADREMIEVRRVYEMEDFPAEVREAAGHAAG
ncbi:MAG TPA: YciI family protein [Solirubrobacteraceae bacterium]|nr:YciI family protein [Solirubrobacteraceae bacterium]